MFSPTAIADFLACQHLTALNRAEAAGQIKRPYFTDPGLDLLVRLGQAHEQNYLTKLTAEGRKIAEIPIDGSRRDAAAKTIEAIRGGAEVVYQATFLDDQWYGRADFVIRVDKPSDLGLFSYEVVETKLARSTKARAIIQLCFYSDLLSRIQGVVPDYMHVVLGGGAKPERFFVQRYLAFFRKIKRDFEAARQAPPKTYPEPVEHCRICDWSTVCDAQWRKDDHLSLVANISRNQRQALVVYGAGTVAGLARLPVPPEPKVEGIKDQAFANIHQQGRLQVQGRAERRNIYELLVPPEPEKGLCSLPSPSPGDIFLDFEGDQFTHEGGLEYLFGVLTIASENGELVYEPTWALKPAEEKRAFQTFIEMVMERRRLYPDMHVYHYGAYEETAIKRMAGQHSTCVDEVDELLRGEVLVDMFRAVRQGLRASVESYSIKKLEPFYEYERDVNLPEANLALQTFQTVLAFGCEEENLDDIKSAIEGYNRDDCVSALRLRDWLEQLRTELEQQIGAPLARPESKHDEPSENLSEYLQRVRVIEEQLTAGLPEDRETWTESQKATALLANLLEWHRREDKSKYWEYFTRCDYSDEEFITDRATLGGLVYVDEVEKVKKSTVHRYRFPLQDTTIERALELRDPKTRSRAGDLQGDVDYEALTIDLKRGPGLAGAPHPTALVPYEIINAKAMQESLLQLGNWVAGHGIEGDSSFAAARELLLRHAPRLKQGELTDFEHLSSLEAAKQIGLLLDRTVLPIQGPPGSGKTFTGAHMIVELIKQGKKVGVTAVSHKVISNLLKGTCKAALERHEKLKILQKCDGDDGCEHDFVEIVDDNKGVEQALANNEAQIIAGTVWLWARPEMANAVDVLFVDEAGQMSLANVLAASPVADSIVLLGDPQQLDQPQRGVHPSGAEASALSHLLNEQKTITADRGLFLAESWRLHPDICAFTSDVFYESRLTSRPENANQQLNVAGPIGGTGLRFLPVKHDANQSDSPEEAKKVAELVETLLRKATWTDKQGQIGLITLEDILIVAPYNAQVSLLLRELPKGSRVGTVDKFQGQEAPVVIYSMATSTPQDAPRGMEFLYSGNRLNVATSRAQCVTVLVASPALFDVQCKTPRQMELANAFCRYLEMADTI
ncbi:MAG TPA: TM0106 family RecB-like putative nuclease [Pyrinomonadaceae bacterium]|nr:TM0106 family RecB-like putative nuclease [Pyrinomonadaceae bacterium]